MGLMLREIEAYQVHHWPLGKADADQRGLVAVINALVPSEMAVEPGTMVLGLVVETLSGRSPLSRLDACLAQHDPARLLGQALPAQAVHAETVGRLLARLDALGPMKRFTACAVRAETLGGVDKRHVHVETTSMRVDGDDALPEDREVPCTLTPGESKAKPPDLQPCVLATLGVDRAVPLWGEPHDGLAAENTGPNTRLSTLAPVMAHPGVAPGAYPDVADAALVTAEQLAALGDPCFISRFPATSSACGRIMQAAVAHDAWEAVGALAQTKPTKQRPATVSNVEEGTVTLDEPP